MQDLTPQEIIARDRSRLAAALHPELGIRVSALDWGQP